VGCHPSIKSAGYRDILNPHGGSFCSLFVRFRRFLLSDLLQPALDRVASIPLGLGKLFGSLPRTRIGGTVRSLAVFIDVQVLAAIAALASVAHVVFMGAIGRVAGKDGDRGCARCSKGGHMENSTSSAFFQQYQRTATIYVCFQQVSR
jgi:hypothetical protein